MYYNSCSRPPEPGRPRFAPIEVPPGYHCSSLVFCYPTLADIICGSSEPCDAPDPDNDCSTRVKRYPSLASIELCHAPSRAPPAAATPPRTLVKQSSIPSNPSNESSKPCLSPVEPCPTPNKPRSTLSRPGSPPASPPPATLASEPPGKNTSSALKGTPTLRIFVRVCQSDHRVSVNLHTHT